jgi:hypothetical protein
MSPITPCYRHARKGWIASCEDCTAWHKTLVRNRRRNDRQRVQSSPAWPSRGDVAPRLPLTPSQGPWAA